MIPPREIEIIVQETNTVTTTFFTSPGDNIIPFRVCRADCPGKDTGLK
jgi:hypothetical protein